MNFFDFSFWQNFASNLLATVIGVALGIPVAFWIDRRVQTANEQEKTNKILQLLYKELLQNEKVLTQWQETMEAEGWVYGPRSDFRQLQANAGFRVIQMADENWRAFSDGGELQWINDPLLLGALADAFGQLGRLRAYVFDVDFPELNYRFEGELGYAGFLSLRKLVDEGLESTIRAKDEIKFHVFEGMLETA
jgi:hypothetical protein